MIMHSFLTFIRPVETTVFIQFNYLEYCQFYFQNSDLEPILLSMSKISVLCSQEADFEQKRFCSSCLRTHQSKISSMGFSFFNLTHLPSYHFNSYFDFVVLLDQFFVSKNS